MENNEISSKILHTIISITSKDIKDYDEMAKETRDTVAKIIEESFPSPLIDQQKYKKALNLIVDNITYTSLALIKTTKNLLNGFIESFQCKYKGN